MQSRARLTRLLRSPEFRRSPLAAVSKRLSWRIHWKLRPESPFVYPLPGGSSIRLAHSSASYGIYLNGGASDDSIAQLFRDYLEPNMVAFDCGAHIGEYTIQFSQLVGSEGQVHAFEPDPRMYVYLTANVAQNRLLNAVVNRVGLGNQEGTASFLLQHDATTSSLSRYAERSGIGEVQIRTTTLDGYVRSRGLQRVDALKIDVEGAEAELVDGARELLSKFRPGLVFVECDRHGNVAAVVTTLQAAGYEVESKHDARHAHPHVIASVVSHK